MTAPLGVVTQLSCSAEKQTCLVMQEYRETDVQESTHTDGSCNGHPEVEEFLVPRGYCSTLQH